MLLRRLKPLLAIVINLLIVYVLLHEILGAPTYTSEQITEVRENAVTRARTDDYQPALVRLAALSRVAPDDIMVWSDYLTVLHWAGHDDEVMTKLASVDLTRAPGYLYDTIVDAAFATTPQGLELLHDRALALLPQHPKLAVQFYTRLSASGEKLARKYIAEAHQKAPANTDITVLLARSLRGHDSHQALHWVGEVLDHQPDRADARLLWANLLADLAASGAANDALQQFEARPDIAKAPELAGQYLVLLSWAGKHESAAKLAEQLATGDTPSYILAQAAHSLRESGRPGEAESLYRLLLKRSAENIEYHKGLALSLLDQHRPAEALTAVAQVAQTDDVLLIRAYAHEALEHFSEALSAMTAAIVQLPAKSRPWHNWAALLSSASGHTSSDQLHRSTNQLWSEAALDTDTRISVVASFYRNRKYRLASQLAATLPANALSATQWGTLARAARDGHDYRAAVAYYQRGIALAPITRSLALGLALSLSEAGNSRLAEKQFDKLLAQYPDNIEILNAWNYHLRRTGQQARSAAVLVHLTELAKNPSPYLKSWEASRLLTETDTTRPALITEFRQMAARFPGHRALRNDTIGLILREKRYREALHYAGTTRLDELDADVLDGLGFAARKLGDNRTSLTYYAAGHQFYPDRANFAAGIVLAFTNLGNFTEARVWARRLGHRFDSNREFLLAKSELARRSNSTFETLAALQRLVRIDPDDRQVFVALVINISTAGAPNMAIVQANNHPGWLSRRDWRTLYADRAAWAIRRGDLPYHTQAEGDTAADQALAELDRYMAYLDHYFPDDRLAHQRASMDRIVALNHRRRHHDAVAEYRKLTADGAAVAPYARIAAADSMLALHHPAAADRLLAPVCTTTPGSLNGPIAPDNFNAAITAFFATEEQDHFDAARTILDDIQLHQPIWRQHTAKAVPRENTKRLLTDRLAAILPAWSGQPAAAQRRLEKMVAAAPRNTDLRINLATVYRQRGWPRRAEGQEQLVAALEPDLQTLAIDQASNQLALNEFRAANRTINRLNQHWPATLQIELLNADWHTHQLHELIVDISRGFNTGTVGNYGKNEWQTDSWLYSSPLHSNYRGFVHHRYSDADFLEGSGTLSRAGAGVEYRSRAINAHIEVDAPLNGVDGAGLTSQVEWRPDDHISLTADASSYSSQVPLRAIRNGVKGSSLGLAAGYRFSESARVNARWSTTDFSDSNRRQELSVGGQYRLIDVPRHELDLLPSIYTSTNNNDNVPYYSPKHDFATELSLSYTGLLRHHYGHSFSHRITAGLGDYHQSGHGGGLIWDLNYEQHWQLGRRLRIYYGASHSHRIYDGDGENHNALYCGIDWRF